MITQNVTYLEKPRNSAFQGTSRYHALFREIANIYNQKKKHLGGFSLLGMPYCGVPLYTRPQYYPLARGRINAHSVEAGSLPISSRPHYETHSTGAASLHIRSSRFWAAAP